MDRLEQEDVFDRALVIVTSDHGVSFRPGVFLRRLVPENYEDIIAVPFFVKVPSQREGRVSGRPVESIDVAETVADVLKRPLPWASDGHSVFESSIPWRQSRRASDSADSKDFEYRSYPARLSGTRTVRRKLSLFGSGEDPESIFGVGDRYGLVGRSVSDFEYDSSLLTVIVEDSRHYENLLLESGLLPVWMRGKIFGHPLEGPRLQLAVALNGRFAATTQTFVDRKGQVSFRALLPERRFRDGVNTFELFVIRKKPTGVHLAQLRKSPWHWKLETERDRLSLVSFDGDRIPVQPGKLVARLAPIKRDRIRTRFAGWAVDRSGKGEEVRVAFFRNGFADGVAETSVVRHDISLRLLGQATDVGKSGFDIQVSNHYLIRQDYQLFAFTDEWAVEIPIPEAAALLH